MGEGGGDNAAEVAAANYDCGDTDSNGYPNYDCGDTDINGDPSPIVLYATVGYLIAAVLAIWPIVQVMRRIKKRRKAQRKKALEDAARSQGAMMMSVGNGYVEVDDHHSFATSTISAGPGPTIAKAKGGANNESVATVKQDNTNYYPPIEPITRMNSNSDLTDATSVATPRRDNKDYTAARPSSDRPISSASKGTTQSLSTRANPVSSNKMSAHTYGERSKRNTQASVSLASKATRGTKASEANRSARSRATAATRMTTRSAATTSTVKSFHSLAGRGGRKALRAAKLANMRPDMAIPMPAPRPTPEAVSSSPYKAAEDDLTLKAVDAGDGATVGTAFTRRTATTAVTTATARSFYSLSARSGRKAITAARLATRAAITSPLALPPTRKKVSSNGKANNSDNATVSMFDEYYSMEVGPLDEEEGNPRGFLIICCADNDFNPDWFEDNVIDTEDVDEGAWDTYEWHELPNHVRDAACLLGCSTNQAWNCGGVVYSNDKSWNELSPAQVKAARVLGFNQQLWDHEVVERTKVVRGFDTYREVVKCDREAGMITSIAIPATWENMLSLCTGAVQVALISQYLGPDVLAAYAVVEGFLSVAYNIGSGLAGAEAVLVCQALGMEDTFLAGQYTLLSIVTYLLSAAPVYITLIFFIDEIIVGLRLGDEVAAIAVLYTPVLTLSHLIEDSFAGNLSSLLRCSGKYVEMAIIDSLFNVLYIILIAIGVGLFNMSLVGIAWVGVVSAVVYGVFIYAYSAAKGWLHPFWGGLTDMRVLVSWRSIKNMITLTFPLAVNEFISSTEWSILSLFAGYIGGVDLNAWSILGSLWAIFEYAPEGINSAVVMRLAFHLGRGDPRSAKITGYRCLAYSGALSLLISVLFYAWHKEIIALFTHSALIATTLEKSVVLIAVGNVIVSIGGTASVVLTALGRPGIATWINGIGMWCISVPLSTWFTFGLDYNTTGLVCGMLIAYTSSSLAVLSCVFTTNWVKASMEVIAAEAEEEEYYRGGGNDGEDDDISTIAQASSAPREDYNNYTRTPESSSESSSLSTADGNDDLSEYGVEASMRPSELLPQVPIP